MSAGMDWNERRMLSHSAQILTQNGTVHLAIIQIKGYIQDMDKNEISYMPS